MILLQDINDKYMISTAQVRFFNLTVWETMVFPVENGEINYKEVCRVRTTEREVGIESHKRMCRRYGVPQKDTV